MYLNIINRGFIATGSFPEIYKHAGTNQSN